MKKIIYTVAVILAFAACNKETVQPQNERINTWILNVMRSNYLWTEHIPQSTDKTLAPEVYFQSLLYKEEDRFSWIENYDDLKKRLSGVQMEAGYDFTPYYKDNTQTDVVGIINYVKRNSPAAQAGLQRGDIFIAINRTRLTGDNYRTLAGTLNQAHSLDLADVADLNNVVRTVTLSVVEYKENPILLDTIYQIEGKKIGYFVYNFFARDNGDKSIAYERELNALFGKFKAENIDELIIDLRYNGGGAVITSIALASMISNRTTKDIFSIAQYNTSLTYQYQNYYGKDYNKNYFLDKISDINVAINKLGAGKLYVIATGSTASASELLINALRPYMEVVIVGGKTYGKNVGSMSYSDASNPDNKWGIQPIIVKYANKDNFSDYGKGFEPNIEVYEKDGGYPFKPLGCTEETMLKTAIDAVFGRTPPSSAQSVTRSAVDKRMGAPLERTWARNGMYIDDFFENENRQ